MEKSEPEIIFYEFVKIDCNEYQQKTVEELEAALKFWSLYAENASQQYINPVFMKRVGWADWEKFKSLFKKILRLQNRALKNDKLLN